MCGGSKPPSPPDPFKTAEAQYQYNTQAAQDALRMNSIDQYGPYGSTTYQRNEDGLPTSQTVNLSPQVQQWLDSQFGASTSLQNAAQQQLGYLPQDRFQLPDSPGAQGYAEQAFGEGTFDHSQWANPLSSPLYQASRQDLTATPDTSNIAQTSYDQAKSLFQPDVDAARKQAEIRLAQRGINPGDEVWNDEMGRLDRQSDNLHAGASRQALLDAGNEQSRQFGVNLGTAQYGAGEDSRMAGADLSNRQFLGTQQNQQFNQALSGLGFGQNQYQTNLSNQLLERNQPYAEAAALMGTSPNFQSPSFMNTPSQGVQAPDYQGAVNQNYQGQLANWQAQQNQSSGMWGALGQIGAAAGPMIFSDEEMKENRSAADGEAVLDHFARMPIDDYDYRQEARAQFAVPESRTGAMAQDYAEHFGGDGKTIDMGDAVGKLMAAVKALDQRTRRAA